LVGILLVLGFSTSNIPGGHMWISHLPQITFNNVFTEVMKLGYASSLFTYEFINFWWTIQNVS